ncbi:MAG: hypothetical protein ABSC19_11865 [Syntrophorhabdales bacterium]
MPAPSAVTERFIVGRIDRALLPAHQDVRIEQTYLRPKNHGEEICIKKRGQDDSYLFFLMRTRHTPYTITEEELIDEQQFSTLKKLIDPKTNVLVKERACFFWNNRHFELDTYRGAYEGLSVLGVEPIEAGTAPDRAAEGQEGATGANEARLSLPPFVSVERAITSNPRYSERAMALKKMR